MDQYRKYELPETYQRYKGYTDQFSKWLWNTAQKRGLEVAEIQDKSNKTKKRRVPVSQLISVTKEIAECGIPLEDMSGLADLNDAIRSRKEVKVWYENHAQADEGHSYIIGALMQARQILKAMFIRGVNEHDVDDENQTTTIFVTFSQRNDVTDHHKDGAEDSDQCVTPEVDQSLPCNLDNTSRKVQMEATPKLRSKEEIELEQNLQVLCFLYDLYQHREVIKNIWDDFANREIDFVTAAIPTDIALATIKQNVAGLVEDLEEAGGRSLEMIIKELQAKPTSAILRDAGVPKFTQTQVSQINRLGGDIFCTYALRHIEEYKRFMRSRTTAKSQGDPIKQEETTEDAVLDASKTFGRTFPHMPFLLFFERVRTKKLYPPVFDNFTLAMIEPNSQPSRWLPFGFQIILDIQSSFRIGSCDCKEEFFFDISDEFFHIAELIREHCDYEDNMWAVGQKPEYMTLGETKFSNVFLKPADDIMRWTDQMHPSSQPVAPESQGKLQAMTMEFISMHPLMSSLVLYHFRRLYNSITITKIQWFIVALCHLYNACQQVGGLNVRWPDLEFIMNIQGEKRIFVGDRPTEPHLFHTRACIAMANSIRGAAKDYHSPDGLWLRADKDTKTKRGLPSHLPLETKIRDYYYNYKTPHRWIRLHNLFAHVKSSTDESMDVIKPVEPSHPPQGDLGTLMADFAHSLKSKSARRNRRRKNKASNKSSGDPVPNFIPRRNVHASLLTSLKGSLQKHELHSKFDYLAFYRRAFSFVLDVRDKILYDESKALTRLDSKGKDRSNHSLLFQLLEDLIGPPPRKIWVKEDDKQVQKYKDDKKDAIAQLRKISDVMRQMIAEQGRAGIDEARKGLRSYWMSEKPRVRCRRRWIPRFTYGSMKSRRQYALAVTLCGLTFMVSGKDMKIIAMKSAVRLLGRKTRGIQYHSHGRDPSQPRNGGKLGSSRSNNTRAYVPWKDPDWENEDLVSPNAASS